MTPKNILKAAPLLKALKELPKVKKGLFSKSGFYDGFELEISAAEMSGGECQGSIHYFYLPPKVGAELLIVVEKFIRAKLKTLGVKAP